MTKLGLAWSLTLTLACTPARADVSAGPERPAAARPEYTAEELRKALNERGRVALYKLSFATAKGTLRPESEPLLREIARLLEIDPMSLTVEAHTDAQGATEWNRRLSGERARAVVDWLGAHGARPERLQAAGIGEERPIASNTTAAGRAQNRRVELVKR